MVTGGFSSRDDRNMITKPSSKKRLSRRTSSTDKGRLIERIVASMHQWPGVKVERNVRLPVPGSRRRRREIDVLITSNVVGYPVRIAVECKNEKPPIGSPKVDAFIGKLDDLGIPAQHGIYVSASGAIERAVSAGIRPLVLGGLTKDALNASVVEAFQSVVYLLLQVVQAQFSNKLNEIENPEQLLAFYDESGAVRGAIPDLIWREWRAGRPPSEIGRHHLEVHVPEGWYQMINGMRERLDSFTTEVHVLGLVVTLTGSAAQYTLTNAAKGLVERNHVSASFQLEKPAYPVAPILTETQLDRFTTQREGVIITVGRFRLPRIRCGALYWPPSERVAKKLVGLMRAVATGEIPDPRPIDIGEIEGTDMETIWEPIWPQHPAVRQTRKEG